MVAGLQDFGDGVAHPFGGFGVVGVFEEAVGEAFLLGRGLISKDIGQQADGGVEDRLGGYFASGKDEVA